jgi:hypothetical protein
MGIRRNLSKIYILLLISILASCASDKNNNSLHINSVPEIIDFNFHVRPILSDRCYACHGPDEKARKGDLRLDLEENAFASLDSLEERFAIVAGDLSKSQLVHRITSQDPEEIMPPPESNLELSQYEIDVLKKWIKQGAEWKPYWAFRQIENPEPPKNTDINWGQNSIDKFVLRRLITEGLHPSKEASKEKLIRRLSFDLRGLPPSLEEIDAFVEDDSPNAYESLVDKFLNQKTYGERMAMEWLDLARYADSHGYQDDIERSMWPWRDWVIKSFNNNMPYDQFATWQLSGDLMPDASYEQKLATGFNRNHKITQEVGVIDEEYRVTYVLDRVNTFSTAFLGLTVECAQCHDHKYDPITQKDYYSLFSFFNSVPEKGRVDYGVEVAQPSLPLPEEKIDELRNYVHGLLSNQQAKLVEYAAAQWNKGINIEELNKSLPTNSVSLPKGLVAWYPIDHLEDSLIEEVISKKYGKAKNELIPISGRHSGGVEFMNSNYAELSPTKNFNFNRPFSISFWIKSLDGGIRGQVLTSAVNEKESNLQIQVDNNKNLTFYLGNYSNETKIQFSNKKTVPENKWTNIAITHDGTLKSDGIKLYQDGKLMEVYVQKDNLKGAIPPSKKMFLGKNVGNSGLVAAQLDELMFFNRPLNDTEINDLIKFNPLSDLANKTDLTESDKKRLLYYNLTHNDQQYQLLNERSREYKIRKGRTDEIVIKPTMVMADLDTARPTFVLGRGQYDAPGEQVYSGTPKAIMDFGEQYSKNRLGLSTWLFDTKNPLTARVAVNRYWQMIFGRGIVATPGDFGSQGALPSHPELLDWLATDFRNSNWNVKELLKTMVMSATYKQSVESNDQLQVRDPDNTLLARGSQTRLPAEMVRDHALAIGGLLSEKIGGPSVKPYQPKGLWLEVASGNQSLRKYIQDHDDELYRRSLYTFWKRTIPPPSMTIFDAPTREQCTIKRGATSTPMQALVLLNDPQFTEASRLLAARMLNEGGKTTEERIKFAFRLATSRVPNAEEVDILTRMLNEEISHFEENPEEAKKLLNIGEYSVDGNISSSNLAAHSVVANAILNVTEAIMKG